MTGVEVLALTLICISPAVGTATLLAMLVIETLVEEYKRAHD